MLVQGSSLYHNIKRPKRAIDSSAFQCWGRHLLAIHPNILNSLTDIVQIAGGRQSPTSRAIIELVVAKGWIDQSRLNCQTIIENVGICVRIYRVRPWSIRIPVSESSRLSVVIPNINAKCSKSVCRQDGLPFAWFHPDGLRYAAKTNFKEKRAREELWYSASLLDRFPLPIVRWCHICCAVARTV